MWLADGARADLAGVHLLLGPVEELVDQFLALDAVCLRLHDWFTGFYALCACLLQTSTKQSRQTPSFRHFARLTP